MASFAVYLPLLQQVEGGFQKLAADPGNYNSLGQLVGTNWGISARFYEGIINRPPTETDMRNLKKDTATGLFRTHFWNRARANEINNQAIANTIVDHHINTGSGVKLAQQVLNDRFGYRLAEDNAMGPITLKAINEVNPAQFVAIYNEARANYYKKIGNSTFIGGWLKRLKKFAYENPGKTIGFGSVLLLGGFFLSYIN